MTYKPMTDEQAAREAAYWDATGRGEIPVEPGWHKVGPDGKRLTGCGGSGLGYSWRRWSENGEVFQSGQRHAWFWVGGKGWERTLMPLPEPPRKEIA